MSTVERATECAKIEMDRSLSDALLIKTTETVTLTNKPYYVVVQREGKVVPRIKPYTFHIYKRNLVGK